MQADDTQTIRLSQWAIEERTIQKQIIENSSKASKEQSQQFKKLMHIPMAKLSFKYVLIKRENQRYLYKKQLPLNSTKSLHNQFHKLRENFQEDIAKFVKVYKAYGAIPDEIQNSNPSSPQMSVHMCRNFSYQQQQKFLLSRGKISEQNSSLLKSRASSKRVNQGGYFFNNWRSYESYYCPGAINLTGQHQNLTARLVYSIIDMDYDMSLKIIQKINQSGKPTNQSYKQTDNAKEVQLAVNQQIKHHSSELIALKIIIKGLKTLCNVIRATDQLNDSTQLTQTFYNREQFNLLQDHYLNDPKAKINLLNLSNLDELVSTDVLRLSELDTQNEYDESKYKKKFDKKPSYNTNLNSPKSQPNKIMKSTQNLMSYRNPPRKHNLNQEWQKFLQLPSKYQKICILSNLMFLINFSKKVRIESCQNDYYKLIFSFLKNGHDQLQSVGMGREYGYSDGHKNSDQYFSNYSQSSSMIGECHINYKSQIDYARLLLQLKQIKIYDRINFATRLLSEQNKANFINELQNKIDKFSCLDNLLLFTKFYKEQLQRQIQELNSYHSIKQQTPRQQVVVKKNRKNSYDGFPKYNTRHQFQKERIVAEKSLRKCLVNKQKLAKKMKSICQNYVDQYGDLATIAYLSNEYPCLSKFYDCYRQSLLLSYEQEQVQNIDSLKQKVSEQWNEKRCFFPKKIQPFLSQINFRQEKVHEDLHKDFFQTESRKCQICNLKILSDRKQSYIQCNKCRHGGHFEHIIKWYSNYQNCPNINCACLCN